MDIWSILGIRQTGEKEEIQRAYRSRLAHTNPEDDPEGFMELRQAFEEAIRAADERKEGMQEKPQWAEGPVGAWIEKVDAVYSRFSRRIDTGEWERLLQEEVCQNLDTCIAARDALLEYMMEHFFLPQKVLQLLDRQFALCENKAELMEHFPPDFLNIAVFESIGRQEYPPYEYLYGDDDLPFEAYLRLSASLNLCIGKGDTVQAEQLIADMEATGITGPFLQIDKAKVLCQQERFREAEQLIVELLPEYGDVEEVLLMQGDISFFLGNYEAASESYEQILQNEPESHWAKFGRAKCLTKKGAYKEAGEIFSGLLQEDPYDTGSEEWLRECNDLFAQQLEAELQEKESAETRMELAWCCYQNGNYEKVLELLQDMKPEQDRVIEFNSMMGRAYLFSGQAERAQAYLSSWRHQLEHMDDSQEKKKEQMPLVLLLESQVCRETGRQKEALELLEKLLEADPENGEALLHKGKLLYDRWELDQAADTLTKAIEADPSSHVPYLLRAKAFYKMEFLGEAFDDCGRALEIYPYELEAYIGQIRILLDAGEIEGADQILNYLRQEELTGTELTFLEGYRMEKTGQKEAAERIYREILFGEAQPDGEKSKTFNLQNGAETCWRLALLEYREDLEDFQPIIDWIDRGLKEDSCYVPLLEMKAEIALQCAHYDEALKLCEKILQTAPGKVGVYGLMDSIYREMQEWETALEYADKQVQQLPSGYAYMRRGQLFTCLDRMDRAWEDFSQAVQLAPELSYPYNYMAVILEYKNEEEAALCYYDKAVETGEETGDFCEEAYENKANLLCRRKEFEQAVSLLERAGEKTGNSRYLYKQIEVFRLAGRWDDARNALEAYIRREEIPKTSFIYNWEMGHICRDKGKQAKALHFYRHAEKLEMAAAKEIAKILYYQGKYKAALKLLEKVTAIFHVTGQEEEDYIMAATFYLWAARCSKKQQDEEGARVFAQKGLELIPEDHPQKISEAQPLVYRLLGALYAVKGEQERANALFEHALNIRKCDFCNYSCCVDALYELGYSAELQGKKEEALSYYRQGRRAAPFDADLACAEKVLEKGNL